MPNFNFGVYLQAKQAQSEAKQLSKDIFNVTKNLQDMAKRGHDTSLEMDLAFRRMSKRAQELNEKIAALKDQQSKLTANTSLGTAAMEAANFAATKLAYGLVSVGAAAAGAIYKLMQFGDTSLKAFASREGQVNAYKQLFKGDLGEAENSYGKGLKIGQLTDLTSSQVLKAQQAIYTAGYHGLDAEKLLAGGLDVATAAPNEERESRLKMYTDALRRIKGREHMSIGDLNRSLGAIGIDSGLIKEYIAKYGFGFKSKNKADIAEYVDKQLTDKQVNPELATKAIKYAISQQFNQGGKLGGFATSRIGSIESLQSNREEAFENIQKSYNSEMLPSVKAYKSALTSATNALDVNTKQGSNFRTVLADLANTSIMLKTAWEEFSTGFFQSFGQGYTDALKEMGINATTLKDGVSEVARAARELGKSFTWLGSIAAKISHSFEEDIVPALEFTKAIYTGNFKEAYAIHKQQQSRYLGKKVKEVDNGFKSTADESMEAMERFGTNEGATKGGGRKDLDGNIVDGRGELIRPIEPPRMFKGKKGKGSGAGRGESDGEGSISNAGSAGSVTGGGVKIGTVHVEMHLHGATWDENKQLIETEGPAVLKQLLEKALTEMGA